MTTVLEQVSFQGIKGNYSRGVANVLGGALPTPVFTAIKTLVEENATLPLMIELRAQGDNPNSFLREAADALGYRSVSIFLRLEMGEEVESNRPFKYTHPSVSFTRNDGAVLDLGRLSHGQKRLFGFLWYLGCYPHVVIADDLSNGMHWEMAERALKAAEDRQCFLAIQDALMLDLMEFSSAEDVSRAFVCCRSVGGGAGPERWSWAPFATDAAQEFHEAYCKGFRHVSEILRTRGLF